MSQSMVRAYKAEGLADVPVIALTGDLYAFFAKHEGRSHYSPDIEPVGRFLRPYPGAGPAVKFWYLDYITMFAEDIDWVTSKAQHGQYLAGTEDEKDEIVKAGYKGTRRTATPGSAVMRARSKRPTPKQSRRRSKGSTHGSPAITTRSRPASRPRPLHCAR